MDTLPFSDEVIKYIEDVIDKKVKQCEERLRREYEQKVAVLQTELNGLKDVKNDVKEFISVKEDVEGLKLSCDTLEQSTKTIKEKADQTAKYANILKANITKHAERADDHEDRQRRKNLVFFGIEEKSSYESWADCEAEVKNIIKDKVLSVEDRLIGTIARAHRIGIKDLKKDKPRPIVVQFDVYKDKEKVLYNSLELNNNTSDPVSIGEDYCKATQKHRRELVQLMKAAKAKNTDIKGGYLSYKSIILVYVRNEQPIRRKFNMYDIKQDADWYIFKSNNADGTT